MKYGNKKWALAYLDELHGALMVIYYTEYKECIEGATACKKAGIRYVYGRV